MSKRSRKAAAAKGWATRRAKQRKQRAVQKARANKRAEELRKIERLLGEDFDNLAQARRALKGQSEPVAVNINTADAYDKFYDRWEESDLDFEDLGEIDAGVDY